MRRLTVRDKQGEPHAVMVDYYTLIEKLTEYEDAEEQGLLLRLPYKFGTKLYCVIDDWDEGLMVAETVFDMESVSDVMMYIDDYCLTKEEAEQALAEMEKN